MASDSDGEWKYGIDEVGEDATEHEDAETGDPNDQEAERRIEPGSPRLENALFVALGALLALVVIARGLGFL